MIRSCGIETNMLLMDEAVHGLCASNPFQRGRTKAHLAPDRPTGANGEEELLLEWALGPRGPGALLCRHVQLGPSARAFSEAMPHTLGLG